MNSPLARSMDVVLDASVVHEADFLNLAPTSSSAVALAIGDALATALMQARGFNALDFARFHPSGQLGRNLQLQVTDLMHHIHKVACAKPDASIREVVIGMTTYPLGISCILDAQNHLIGIITDGDVRRALQKHEEIRGLCALEVMTCNPIVISASALIMCARPSSSKATEANKRLQTWLRLILIDGVIFGIVGNDIEILTPFLS
jgi:arabinose-5-phosphate isomerase